MDIYRYKVDFSNVKHFIDIHEILKRDLDFPDYYGGNLDALWDCLTDQLLSGITYIEFYNTRRPHSKIQYKTPEQKEREYAATFGIIELE